MIVFITLHICIISTQMASRVTRISALQKEVEIQWSIEWFENIILPSLDEHHLTNDDKNLIIWIEITRNPNTTLELIKKYPHFPWYKPTISFELIKSIDFIKENPGFPFISWNLISSNMNISLDDIEANPQFPWDYTRISGRKDCTLEFVRRHPDKNWDYNVLGENEYMWDDIQENPQKYNPMSVLHNKRVTLEYIEANMNVYVEDDFALRFIASMSVVTLEFIEKYFHHFMIYWLAGNPNITIDFVFKHDLNMSIVFMCDFSLLNPSVTPELVKSNSDIPWDWYTLSKRPNFSPKENPEFPWNWNTYALNLNFNIENVPENCLKDLNWNKLSRNLDICSKDQLNKYSFYINWGEMTKNPHITMDFVFNHPEFPWWYDDLPLNPNCTFAVLMKYPAERLIDNLYRICKSSLKVDKTNFINMQYKRHLAAYRVQQHWNLVRTDPNYAICRKKLTMDFEYLHRIIPFAQNHHCNATDVILM